MKNNLRPDYRLVAITCILVIFFSLFFFISKNIYAALKTATTSNGLIFLRKPPKVLGVGPMDIS